MIQLNGLEWYYYIMEIFTVSMYRKYVRISYEFIVNLLSFITLKIILLWRGIDYAWSTSPSLCVISYCCEDSVDYPRNTILP